MYDGEWKRDMQHGFGTEKWTDAAYSEFTGEFAEGLRNGKGVLITDNKKYDGDWSNNMMEGLGIMEFGLHQDSSNYASQQKKTLTQGKPA